MCCGSRSRPLPRILPDSPYEGRKVGYKPIRAFSHSVANSNAAVANERLRWWFRLLSSLFIIIRVRGVFTDIFVREGKEGRGGGIPLLHVVEQLNLEQLHTPYIPTR